VFRNLAYDDFIAVAEDLIARKVTSANKLGKLALVLLCVVLLSCCTIVFIFSTTLFVCCVYICIY
jgi:hypothetical protein